MDTACAASITVAQAADALSVSERTVWRYLKAGRLEGITVGEPGTQRTLISRDSLESLSRSRSTGDIARVRAERDRLAQNLAAAHNELAALRGRIASLQSALARRDRPARVERALGGAIAALTRVRVG